MRILFLAAALLSSTAPANTFLHRGDPRIAEVCLTFDDGPSAAATPSILAALERENIKATFFVVGREVRANPLLAQAMLAEGHELANHTENHTYLDRLGPDQILRELSLGRDSIFEAVGVTTNLMRPPGMHYNGEVLFVAEQLGMITVGWTVGASDFMLNLEDSRLSPSLRASWRPPTKESVEKKVLDNVKNGSIILLHENEVTASALPRILAEVKRRGFKFVTVSEMLQRSLASQTN